MQERLSSKIFKRTAGGRVKMRTYKEHVNKKLNNPEFKDLYDEEKYLLELGLKILEARKQIGLSQIELSKKSRITQQQLSKIENGINCNLLTFLRVSNALGISLNMENHKTAAV